jgi:uncharacterized protein with GYD domain
MVALHNAAADCGSMQDILSAHSAKVGGAVHAGARVARSVRTKTLKAFPEAAYREIIASLG